MRCPGCGAQQRPATLTASTEVAMLDEFEGPPSFRNLVADGYTVITF